MATQKTNTDFRHRVPADLKAVLHKNKDVFEIWNKLTPLARNEWICWVTIVKQEKTRKEHLKRLCQNLRSGKRRPCCWPGCPHRREGATKYFKSIK